MLCVAHSCWVFPPGGSSLEGAAREKERKQSSSRALCLSLSREKKGEEGRRTSIARSSKEEEEAGWRVGKESIRRTDNRRSSFCCVLLYDCACVCVCVCVCVFPMAKTKAEDGVSADFLPSTSGDAPSLSEKSGNVKENSGSGSGGFAAMNDLVMRATDTSRKFVGSARPWSEAFDKNSFARPTTISEATARIRKNIYYFKINYVLAMTTVLLVTMIMYPKSLAILSALLVMWVYLYAIRTKPVIINGTPIEGNIKLMACSALTFLVVFFLTVGSTIHTENPYTNCKLEIE